MPLFSDAQRVKVPKLPGYRLPGAPFLKEHPVFRDFLVASTVSLTGTSIFDIAIPIYVLQRTGSAMALSLVAVSLHLPHFLMAPLTGFLADNFAKRRIMLFSDLGQVVCMLFLLAYEMMGFEPIWPLLLCVFFAKSMMLTFETVATFQLIPGLVPPNQLAAANTWFLCLHRLIQIAGPSLGGLLMGVFGVRICIVVNILSFGATLFYTYRMKNLDALLDQAFGTSYAQKGRGKRITFGNMMESFIDSLRFVWASALFKPFISLMFLWNLSPLTLNSPTMTYYFTATHHYSPEQYGMIVSSFGILGIIGFLLSSAVYRKLDFARAFVLSSLVQAIFCSVAVLFFNFPIVLAFFYAISRTGSSVLSIGTFFLRQTKVPIEKAGGVNACLRMFFMSAAPVSALLQGLMLEHLGVASALFFGALCLWGTHLFSKEVANAYPSPSEKRKTAQAA